MNVSSFVWIIERDRGRVNTKVPLRSDGSRTINEDYCVLYSLPKVLRSAWHPKAILRSIRLSPEVTLTHGTGA